jgi:hypothetical protein
LAFLGGRQEVGAGDGGDARHAFKYEAAENAPRPWCEDNGFEIAERRAGGSPRLPAAPYTIELAIQRGLTRRLRPASTRIARS